MNGNHQLNNTHFFRYLVHFVARAFLIAILCFILLFGSIIFIYLGDLFIHIKDGDSTNPLFSAYVIVSPSMVPTIMINDAIIVKRVDHDQYRVGDIITFNSSDSNYEGLAITHRIVNKEKRNEYSSTYTTKGDNNSVVDPATVQTDAIYGKVLFKIPKIGYVQNFLSKPSNFFLCLLVPASIFIFYDIFRVLFMLSKKKGI